MPRTITNLSNLPAIFDALYAIASAVPGINWSATYQGLWPGNDQITGYPTLVCPYPDFAGYSSGGRLTGKTLVPGTQLIEMTHDFYVFAVAPYNRSIAATWRTPMAAMGLIQQTFAANRYLNATCDNIKLSDPHLLEWHDKTNPALRFFGCQIIIEAYERILTPFT